MRQRPSRTPSNCRPINEFKEQSRLFKPKTIGEGVQSMFTERRPGKFLGNEKGSRFPTALATRFSGFFLRRLGLHPHSALFNLASPLPRTAADSSSSSIGIPA